MASTYGDNLRKEGSSPRPKGRGPENAKNILCRNITIYGHCRYEKEGCAYNHSKQKPAGPVATTDSLKKRLNVESPSFTPLQPVSNGLTSNKVTISPNATSAPVFTPRASRTGTSTPEFHPKTNLSDLNSNNFPEFIPRSYDVDSLPNHDHKETSTDIINDYDPFSSTQPSLSGIDIHNQQPQIVPYSQDASTLGNTGYYQEHAFTPPVQYHLYTPLGPHRENLLAYQRTAHDLFIENNLREDLQRKSEAALQVLPNLKLPARVDHFHSLVPLDINNQRNAAVFGYPSWVYKAVSQRDGLRYVLRRLEGFRLTDERAIRAVQPWKRLDNGNVVSIQDAFTTRAFGDSSLIIVTDYHPLSKTVAEQHSLAKPRFQGNRPVVAHVPEQSLWSYVVQIASALKSIHSNGLAARVILPSKTVITSRNRIRLNGCGVLDVVQFENSRPLVDLQREDLQLFGQLMLSIATNNPTAGTAPHKALKQIERSYSERFRDCINWLISPVIPGTPTISGPQGSAGIAVAAAAPSVTFSDANTKDIDSFLIRISSQVVSALDSSLHAEDTLMSSLSSELENARLVRLLAKLGFINERHEFEHSAQWSETGERYYLKLFRDYVFHQVDAAGNPVVDLAHVLSCLNKLDAGSEEKVSLVSRDEQNCLVVSYRELKRGVDLAFQELMKDGATRRL